MSANITDYFNKASNMNGSYPAVATVTSARSAGGATLACDDLSSWATDTPVHFSTFQTTADGSVDTTTQTDWKGIVVGNTITEMTRLAGAADSGNASGDRVELNPTIGWLDDLVTGLLVSHKQNGGLKDSSVTESSITTGAVTTSKIADSAVTNAKIADGTIQAQKIDFTNIGNQITINQTSTGKVTTNYVTTASLTMNNSGTYAFIGVSRAEFYGSVDQNCYLQLALNGTPLTDIMVGGFYGGKQGSTLGQFTITTVGYATVAANDVVAAQIRFNNSNGGFANRNSLLAIRIG